RGSPDIRLATVLGARPSRGPGSPSRTSYRPRQRQGWVGKTKASAPGPPTPRALGRRRRRLLRALALRRERAAYATVGLVDDPYDLTESDWRRRFSRRLAEARSLERAHARATALAVTEHTVPPTPHAKRAPSPALLAHLARVRPRGHRAR